MSNPPSFDSLPLDQRMPRLLRAARQLGGFTSAARLAATINEPGFGERAIAGMEAGAGSGDRLPGPKELRVIARACGIDELHFYRAHEVDDTTSVRLRNAREICGLTRERLAMHLLDAEAMERGRLDSLSIDHWVAAIAEWEEDPGAVPSDDEYRLLATALRVPVRLLRPQLGEASAIGDEVERLRAELTTRERDFQQERERLLAQQKHDRQIAQQSMDIAQRALREREREAAEIAVESAEGTLDELLRSAEEQGSDDRLDYLITRARADVANAIHALVELTTGRLDPLAHHIMEADRDFVAWSEHEREATARLNELLAGGDAKPEEVERARQDLRTATLLASSARRRLDDLHGGGQRDELARAERSLQEAHVKLARARIDGEPTTPRMDALHAAERAIVEPLAASPQAVARMRARLARLRELNSANLASREPFVARIRSYQAPMRLERDRVEEASLARVLSAIDEGIMPPDPRRELEEEMEARASSATPPESEQPAGRTESSRGGRGRRRRAG